MPYKAIELIFVLASLLLTQEMGWRGIVPLHSTRKDVEQLVGIPKATRASTYMTKRGQNYSAVLGWRL